MASKMKRATSYFGPVLHKALKLKSFETSCFITEIVNQAMKKLFSKDTEDLLT